MTLVVGQAHNRVSVYRRIVTNTKLRYLRSIDVHIGRAPMLPPPLLLLLPRLLRLCVLCCDMMHACTAIK